MTTDFAGSGLYYFSEDADDPSISLGNTPLIEAVTAGGYAPMIHRPSTDESWAAFSEGSFDITDKLSATLGLRYTKEEKTDSASGWTYPKAAIPASHASCLTDGEEKHQ